MSQIDSCQSKPKINNLAVLENLEKRVCSDSNTISIYKLPYVINGNKYPFIAILVVRINFVINGNKWQCNKW